MYGSGICIKIEVDLIALNLTEMSQQITIFGDFLFKPSQMLCFKLPILLCSMQLE